MKLNYIYIIFSFLMTSCSSIGSNLKIERYEVDALNKTDFYVFIKKSEYENEQYESEKNEILLSCSKAMKKKGFNVAQAPINEEVSAKVYASGAIAVRTYHEIKNMPQDSRSIFYIIFEKYNQKNSIIEKIYGIKIKSPMDGFSSEVIQEICSSAAENL